MRANKVLKPKFLEGKPNITRQILGHLIIGQAVADRIPSAKSVNRETRAKKQNSEV